MSDVASHSLTSGFPRPTSALYHALRIVPSSALPALRDWLSWWHEISQIPLSVSDPGVAEAKLGWWLQEIRAASTGNGQHPLMKQLLAQPPGALPDWALWLEQIEGTIHLVHQNRWMDQASLDHHIHHTTAAATACVAWLLGARSNEAQTAARQLGLGLRRAHMLARLGQDGRAGWVHVSVDVLQTHGVRAHQITRPDPVDTLSEDPHWQALLAHLHQSAAQDLRGGLAQIEALPAMERKALRPLRAFALMQLALIDEIAQLGDRVLHERIVVSPLRKLWLATLVRYGWR